MTKLTSWGAALAAAAAFITQGSMAKQVSGSTSADTKATLFSNKATAYPNAKDSTGTAASPNVLLWEIENLTWLDEDSGLSFMELTTTLTAPILATDTVTFHVEFKSDK